MPWIVIVFALAVGPLGAISIGLVIAQPVRCNRGDDQCYHLDLAGYGYNWFRLE
jgi:hypothetical protein